MSRTATAVALLVTAVALALAPSGALAQQSGEDHVIEGAIENGTGGIYDTSGLRVVLHTSGAETANVETTTDSEGRFRFVGVCLTRESPTRAVDPISGRNLRHDHKLRNLNHDADCVRSEERCRDYRGS